MASVSSLDKDLRQMRLDKYTPTAARDAKQWIEDMLGDRLPGGDLLEGLKDGVALCRLVNKVLPVPGIRYKRLATPFVQMENISQFLEACKNAPFHLQQHDTFLTVDLYEKKDPAQVLQCLGAFSRAAHQAAPTAFPTSIGLKARASIISPQSTGPVSRGGVVASGFGSSVGTSAHSALRSPLSPTKTGGSPAGRWSPTKSPNGGTTSPLPAVATSSWSRREHEGVTEPAWNIAQYGYMGGASQGNLGISFGGRRQITSLSPVIPTFAEKEKERRERDAEDDRCRVRAEVERSRVQVEEDERRRRAEMLKAEEERAQLEEERIWEEETQRMREAQRRRAAEEKRKWKEEEERMWRATQEQRRKEEAEAEAILAQERQRRMKISDSRLQGQFLGDYQAQHSGGGGGGDGGDGGDDSGGDASGQAATEDDNYGGRVKELERELELARQREADYERERAEQAERASKEWAGRQAEPKSRARSKSRSRPASRLESWSKGELEYLSLGTDWTRNRQPEKKLPGQQSHQQSPQQPPPPQQQQQLYPDESFAGSTTPVTTTTSEPPRPLPSPSPAVVKTHITGGGSVGVGRRVGSGGGEGSAEERGEGGAEGGEGTGEEWGRGGGREGLRGGGPRPLPDPARYASMPGPSGSAASGRPPLPVRETTEARTGTVQRTYSREVGLTTAERDGEDQRRTDSQAATRASGVASRSLLEREMELERQRQREWEESQRDTAVRALEPAAAAAAVDGVGGRWDVSQWPGYAGGDGQNRGSHGIGATRRQIVGPRPLPPR